jgi:serine/threonine protein kinase
MEKFKLDIFEKNNPSKRIDFWTLNIDDSSWILGLLKKMLENNINISTTERFYQDLEQYLTNEYVDFDEIDESLLINLFRELKIKESTMCFVIWEIESKVNIFEIRELIDKWEYIWYDASDEAMVLFMPGIKQILLITDQGYIKTSALPRSV